MLATDRKLPVSGGAEKRTYVRGMFHAIAPSYDFLNHVLSLNLDKRWRRKAVARLNWERVPDGRYLDLCAGTLDLAATLARQPGFRGLVVGSDFVPRMLRLGRGKAERIESVAADSLELPYPDATFDGATVGFGARNLMDLDAGLREAARVLKPGARYVILEVSIPPWQPLRGLFLLYFRRILPSVGRLVSRHSNAYTWLPESVLAFPEPSDLAERMTRAGFRDVSWTLLFGGVCAVHVGTRA
jgi:demethylmenaquinone methyltransferase / 2-methoxy-6-polyprenyl-1,4-benzoquinol methylase